MRRSLPLLAILSTAALRPAMAQVLSPVMVDDPYIWLEEKDGAEGDGVGRHRKRKDAAAAGE